MKNISEYKQVIIGIDHGYGNIKTAHEVFRCGVEKLTGDAIKQISTLSLLIAY